MKLYTQTFTVVHKTSNLFLLPTLLLSFITSATASKRGVSMISDLNLPDWSLLGRSEISWYWNWSPYPSNASLVGNLTFVPQIHGLTNIEVNIEQAKAQSSKSTHLMTFNEPDGASSTGGTSISASDAAKAYIKNILPLHKANGGRFLISHPATTGSTQGIEWLTAFNTSCYKLAPTTGCPLDFITMHWYGDFIGLSNWVTQLDDFYNNGTSANSTSHLKMWVSELALPKADAQTTLQMMNQSLSYLDKKDFVEGYSWFGMFRADRSNEWTGANVALFDKNGGLTQLGAQYLNSEGNATFKEGQKGVGGAKNLGVGKNISIVLCLGWLSMMVVNDGFLNRSNITIKRAIEEPLGLRRSRMTIGPVLQILESRDSSTPPGIHLSSIYTFGVTSPEIAKQMRQHSLLSARKSLRSMKSDHKFLFAYDLDPN